MGFLSLPEASLHYLHTFGAMRHFKYHICEFPMTNTLTIESCIIQLVCVWEGGREAAYAPPPPFPLLMLDLNMALSLVFNSYVEANSYQIIIMYQQ